MPRTFVGLAIGNLIVVVAAGVVGMMRVADPSYHVVLAVFALLVTCVVQVLLFTYFTVSGKVLAEAVHLGRLDAAPLARIAVRKRSNTRMLGAVIVALVLVTATGASSWRGGEASPWHYAAAGLIVTVLVMAFVRQYALVVENSRELEGVMSEYAQARRGSADSGSGSV